MGLIDSHHEYSPIGILPDDDLLNVFSYLSLRDKVLSRR